MDRLGEGQTEALRYLCRADELSGVHCSAHGPNATPDGVTGSLLT